MSAYDDNRQPITPLEGDDDPFEDGRAGVGFVCAPTYRWMRDRRKRDACGSRVDAGFRPASNG